MSSTAIVRISTAEILNDPARYQTLQSMSAVIYAGGAPMGMIPSCIKSPQQALAGMLMLVGMGEDPIVGLQYLHPLPGNKLTLDYKFLMGVVERNAPEWMYEVEEETESVVRGWFQAPGKPKYHLTYLYAQAERAGLTKNDVWHKHRDHMMFKSWWLRGARRTAPAALRGVPMQHDVEVDDTEFDVTAPDSPAAPVEPAPVAASSPVPAPAPTDAAKGGAVEDYREMFLDYAQSKGFQVKGRGNGQRLGQLLKDILTIDGVAPTFKTSAEVGPADWKLAYTRLVAKYGSSVEVVPDEDAGNAGGTTPTPAAAMEAAPASEPDELPLDDAPPMSMSDMAAEGLDEKAIIEDQMKTFDYLHAISLELEAVWKQKESVVRPDKRGRMWFTNRDILLSCGYKDEKGASIPKALFSEGVSDSKWLLGEHEVYALSLQVQTALATARNGGKPTAFQQQT